MHRLFILFVLVAMTLPLSAATVFRCDMPDGSVAFSDRECVSGDSRQLDVEAQSIGGSLAPSQEYFELEADRQRERSRRESVQRYQNARDAANAAPCRQFSSTELRRMIIRHQVVRGMTTQDATRAWGAPTRINGDQHAYHWVRGGSSYFYTDRGCIRSVQGSYNG